MASDESARGGVAGSRLECPGTRRKVEGPPWRPPHPTRHGHCHDSSCRREELSGHDTLARRLDLHRRRFLTSAASGLGAAPSSRSRDDGLLATDATRARCRRVRLISRPGPGTASSSSWPGGPARSSSSTPSRSSPALTGQKLPDSFFARERFFSIKPDQALVMGSPFGFRRYGQSGLEMSELLPHIGECADDIALVRSMHTDQFDHGPAEILFSTGIDTPGPAQRRGVGHVRPGERVAGPARLRRAGDRPRAGVAVARPGATASCRPPTPACCSRSAASRC